MTTNFAKLIGRFGRCADPEPVIPPGITAFREHRDMVMLGKVKQSSVTIGGHLFEFEDGGRQHVVVVSVDGLRFGLREARYFVHDLDEKEQHERSRSITQVQDGHRPDASDSEGVGDIRQKRRSAWLHRWYD